MPTVSEMGQLWEIHTNNIRSMWSGEQTASQAANNIVKQLKEAIELMNSGKYWDYGQKKEWHCICVPYTGFSFYIFGDFSANCIYGNFIIYKLQYVSLR